VCQDNAPVARAVTTFGGLDRVEANSDGMVPDGVNVRLETGPVDRSDHLGEKIRRPDEESDAVRLARVRLKEGRSGVLDDAVGEELHGVSGQPGMDEPSYTFSALE